MQLLLPIFVLTLMLTKINGYRILGLFPHPGISHFNFFHPIMRGLAEAGHDVTVVSHFPDKSPAAHYHDQPLTGKNTLTNSVDLEWFEKRRFYSHFVEFFLLFNWGKEACEHTLKSQAIQNILKMNKKNHFDVIIMEQFNTDCMMGIAHIIKAPVIGLSSCALMPWHYNRIGNPAIPSYIPALFMGQSEEMSFFGRVGNWITFHVLQIMYNQYSEKAATHLVRHKFGNDMPAIGDLVKETNLMFVNQHYSLSGAKPISPSVIELGGIHIQKAKTIEADIQKILDNAEHGIIYISWGSMIRSESLPIEKRDAILRALSRLKQKIIWKWENDTLTHQPGNVFINKWLPQREILCHPKTKVFWSHGGLLGSSEAAYCGIPTILTPMYGDQFLNSAALKHRGMGTILHYEDITESNVFKAMREALGQKSMESAKVVSYSFKNRPKKALEEAIWWVEHVAKTEGAPLTKSIASYLPWYSYYCLDIYIFLIFVTFMSIGIWIWLWRQIICSKKKSTITKSKRH